MDTAEFWGQSFGGKNNAATAKFFWRQSFFGGIVECSREGKDRTCTFVGSAKISAENI